MDDIIHIMGYKEDGRTYLWAAPGELISQEVKKYVRKDEPVVLSGGRIKPYAMHREMVPASFLLPSKMGNDDQGVVLNFRTIDGKVNPWGDPYKWFKENQGREVLGSLKRVTNGHVSWVLSIDAGLDVERLTIRFDEPPEELSEGLLVFNVTKFRPIKR